MPAGVVLGCAMAACLSVELDSLAKGFMQHLAPLKGVACRERTSGMCC